MAYTIATIKAELEGRRYPSILTNADYEQILAASLRELTRYYPLTRFASFETVEGSQDYYVFDTENTITSGICAGALAINDVLWNPGGDWSSLNIFSPGWTMLAQMVVFTGSFFHQPGQMMVLRQKLDAWKTQFGSCGFDVIGMVDDPAAVLRLYPVPQTTGAKVVVEFAAGYALADITAAMLPYLMQWVEHYAADTLANMYAQTADVKLLGFANSNSAMDYWQGKANKAREYAQGIQGGPGGAAMRG